jgi:hypothetical protein
MNNLIVIKLSELLLNPLNNVDNIEILKRHSNTYCSKIINYSNNQNLLPITNIENKYTLNQIVRINKLDKLNKLKQFVNHDNNKKNFRMQQFF